MHGAATPEALSGTLPRPSTERFAEHSLKLTVNSLKLTENLLKLAEKFAGIALKCR